MLLLAVTNYFYREYVNKRGSLGRQTIRVYGRVFVERSAVYVYVCTKRSMWN